MFSIVIPVWNKRHTLGRTIASVLAQSRSDFEIVLVDDGSTDGSLEVLKGFPDPRLRVVAAQSRGGPGRARNIGIEAARHEWVAFLDADDIWLPWHLEELARVCARFPEAGLVATSYVGSDAKGRFVLPPDRGGKLERLCLFDCLGSGERTFWTSVTAVPRSTCAELGGFRSFASGEDNEFWSRVALDRPVARSTRITAVYMHGTGGISDGYTGPWRGRDLRETADLSPAVALLLERWPTLRPETQRGVERFIEAHIDWCLRFSAGRGDMAAIRALPPLYRRTPPPLHRLLLASASLPTPLARGLAGAALSLDSLARRLRKAASFAGAATRARKPR